MRGTSSPSHERLSSPPRKRVRKRHGVCNPQAIAKAFNTALVTSRSEEKQNLSDSIFALTESSAFRSILQAIEHHAEINGLTHKDASLEIIQTFRKLDQLWLHYLLEEGLERLRRPQS